MFDVIEDGNVGSWHRWVILSVASAVLTFYFVFAGANILIRFTGMDQKFGLVLPHDPFDVRLLLIAIPWGILRGEAGYRRDLEANGSKTNPSLEKAPKEP